MTPLEGVIDALDRGGHKPKRNGDGWTALCPTHADKTPSLSITERDGKVLLKCFAGCETDAVIEALGLSWTDLFNDPPKTTHSKGHRATKPTLTLPKTLKDFAKQRCLKPSTLEKFKVEIKDHKGRTALIYPTALEVDRVKYLDGKKPKYFWDGKGGKIHLYGINGAKKTGGSVLYIVNGEPSVWACAEAGVPAVCLCAGEGTLPPPEIIEELKTLSFSELRIVYDLDEPGRKGALKLLKHLRENGLKVKALKLPEYLGKGGDAGDLYRLKKENFKTILEELPDLQEPGAAVVKLEDIEAEEVSWLWEPYIPAGKVTILQGDPAAGKTFMAIDFCARLTREGKKIIYGTLEDGLADTIKPRAEKQKANQRLFTVLEGERTEDGTVHFVTLERPDIIEDAIKREKPALLVLDPISGWLGGGADINRANQVRAKLAPLVKLAEAYGVAVLVIQHLTKGRADKALYRGSGSVDFVAAARSVLLMGKSSDDSQALCQVKNSLGPLGGSLGYLIDEEGFHWTGEVDLTAADLLGADQDPEEKSAMEEAMTWLEAELSDGPKQAGDLQRRFEKETGISRRTLQSALRKLGGIRSKDGFNGGWIWRLPEDDNHAPKAQNKLNSFAFDENTTLKGLQGKHSTEGEKIESVLHLRDDIEESEEELISRLKARRMELEGI